MVQSSAMSWPGETGSSLLRAARRLAGEHRCAVFLLRSFTVALLLLQVSPHQLLAVKKTWNVPTRGHARFERCCGHSHAAVIW
jgi:hypothetical protein